MQANVLKKHYVYKILDNLKENFCIKKFKGFINKINERDIKKNGIFTRMEFFEDVKEIGRDLVKEFESDDMKMDSEEMKEIRDYISSGYGDFYATGIDKNGKKQGISSSQDAAYCIDIADGLDDNDFVKESKNFIVKFEDYKNRQRNI